MPDFDGNADGMRILPSNTLKFAFALALMGALAGGQSKADTLDDAIAAALTSDPSLAAARTNVDAADASRAAAFAQFLPTLSASVTRGESWSNASTFDTTTGTVTSAGSNENASASLDVSQTLFSSGKLLASYSAARADEERAKQTYRAQEDALIVTVVQAFVGVLYGEQSVAIDTDDVERLAKEVDAANIRFEAGAATKTDVYQAQTQLAAARSALATAQADLTSKRASYYRRVGAMPGTLEKPPLPVVPADVDTAIANASAHAPEVAAATAAVKAAKSRTRSAFASYLPSLTLSGTAGRRGDDGFEGFDNDTASASLRLAVPIFSGGRTTAAVRQAKASERGAKFTLDDTLRASEESVTQVWAQLDAAKQRVDASNAQLEAATFARRGAELERREGLRTQLELLDQISNENTAALAVAAANRDVLTAAYQLLQATGELPRPQLKKRGK